MPRKRTRSAPGSGTAHPLGRMVLGSSTLTPWPRRGPATYPLSSIPDTVEPHVTAKAMAVFAELTDGLACCPQTR
ncbi:hypothetical protein [Streptomyces rhizosphaericus]|uniref:hypothetical protein n=1 Tax=Streptomyces rhizosphaericus TaxID=114699 RepID=UPI000A3783D0|nr:hypothetical protein [Streptomyces rhizosphaericus]